MSDAWVLVRRELWHLRAQPGQLVAALIFPAAMVVLFGFVFGGAIRVPGEPVGQAGSGGLVGVTQRASMAGGGLVDGGRAHAGPARALAAVGVRFVFRAAMSWIGVVVGLVVTDEKSVDPLGPLLFPV